MYFFQNTFLNEIAFLNQNNLRKGQEKGCKHFFPAIPDFFQAKQK